MSDNEEPPVNGNLEESSNGERGRLWRTFRFMMAVMVFYVVMIFLDYEHDTILLIIGASCFVLWLIYMTVMILMMICGDSAADLADAEEQRLTTDGLTMRNHEPSSELADDLYSVSFSRTSKYIRSNPDPITPGVSPMDGSYDIVYNAVLFGKTLRSQAQLNLSFKAMSNGWEITGTSETASGSRPIAEGFVNSIGQMYWLIHDERQDPCIYRGVLEIETSAMWDGELQSVGDGTNGAKGRIVRLQKCDDPSGAAVGMPSSASSKISNRSLPSASVEMVDFSSKRNIIV